MFAAIDGELVALLGVADPIKATTSNAIRTSRKRAHGGDGYR